jgi:hypothetical protein
MRRIRLSLCVAVALSALAYSGAQAAGINCAVNFPAHNGSSLWLHHHKIASCSGAYGCKFVACYDWNGSVYAAGYPLVAPGK